MARVALFVCVACCMVAKLFQSVKETVCLTHDQYSQIIITRHGKPAGVLIGFETEDDWFDYRLENDPRFLKRIEAARTSLRLGRGVKIEDVEE